jgi:hypothetical protein
MPRCLADRIVGEHSAPEMRHDFGRRMFAHAILSKS